MAIGWGRDVHDLMFRFQSCRKYVKIMSSRYERRRERDPEPEERTQRPISPGPPRKRSRTDTDPPIMRSTYQRPISPSPKQYSSTPRYPAAASYHKPPQTPMPTTRPHRQDERHETGPRLSNTPKGSFTAQPPTPTQKDPKESPNHTSKSNPPLKITNALATLSSSTAFSSILSRPDGAEPPQRTPKSISQSPAPASVSASVSGVSATQFDLAKLRSLSQALHDHGTISAAPTNGNNNSHTPKPAVVPTEPRPTHPIAAERSSSSLVCCPTHCFV